VTELGELQGRPGNGDGAAAEAGEPPVSPPPGPTGGLLEMPEALPPVEEVRAKRFGFTGSLRERAARGTIVNAVYLVALGGLNLVRAFVLARFISPSDYGLWGVLVISMGTLLWLKQVGISDKYIQQDEPDQEAAFQKAFTLEFLITGVLCLLIAIALPLIVAIYGASELVLPGLVVLVGVMISIFQAPVWIYYRRMQYVRQRVLQGLDPIVGFVASVGAAVAGAGYWSFAIGFVAGVAAASIGATIAAPYKMRWRFERDTLREYFTFSWPIFVASGSALVMAQAAVLTARWHLGLAATGMIALATTISAFTERIDEMITGTLYPAICAVKDQISLLYESFVKSNRLALMWAVPFGVGLTLFAADLVSYGIGEQWRPAVVVLQVFGVTAAVNHIGFNWNAYFQARADTRPIAVTSIGSTTAFLFIGIPVFLALGLKGYAIALAIFTVAQLVLRAYYLQKLFSGFSFLAHAARAFLPTIPAVAVVLLVRLLEPTDRSAGLAWAELAVYIAVTLTATWLFEAKLLREAIGYVFASGAAEGADDGARAPSGG
jgi:O-antigen/teichoic acid export membrane protein